MLSKPNSRYLRGGGQLAFQHLLIQLSYYRWWQVSKHVRVWTRKRNRKSRSDTCSNCHAEWDQSRRGLGCSGQPRVVKFACWIVSGAAWIWHYDRRYFLGSLVVSYGLSGVQIRFYAKKLSVSCWWSGVLAMWSTVFCSSLRWVLDPNLRNLFLSTNWWSHSGYWLSEWANTTGLVRPSK